MLQEKAAESVWEAVIVVEAIVQTIINSGGCAWGARRRRPR